MHAGGPSGHLLLDRRTSWAAPETGPAWGEGGGRGEVPRRRGEFGVTKVMTVHWACEGCVKICNLIRSKLTY